MIKKTWRQKLADIAARANAIGGQIGEKFKDDARLPLSEEDGKKLVEHFAQQMQNYQITHD